MIKLIPVEDEQKDARNDRRGILRSNKKIHKPDCDSVKDIKAQNKKYTGKTIDDLISEGYTPCKMCNPE